MSEKSITWQQFWLNGGHKSVIETLQSRPRACSGNKFAVNENSRGVLSVTSMSKSEILVYFACLSLLKEKATYAYHTTGWSIIY